MLFELAYVIGMPVYQLVEEMPYTEFLQWQSYFEMRPVGWRDDNRFMRVLQAMGIKEAPEKIFGSLAQMKKAEDANSALLPNQISMASLKNSSLFSKMLQAQGGDNIWSTNEDTGEGH